MFQETKVISRNQNEMRKKKHKKKHNMTCTSGQLLLEDVWTQQYEAFSSYDGLCYDVLNYLKFELRF